jgi:hypothetical protein
LEGKSLRIRQRGSHSFSIKGRVRNGPVFLLPTFVIWNISVIPDAASKVDIESCRTACQIYKFQIKYFERVPNKLSRQLAAE